MICPKCGFDIEDGFAFCPQCGAKVEDNSFVKLSDAFSSMIEKKEEKEALREKLLSRFNSSSKEKQKEDALGYLEQYKKLFGEDFDYSFALLKFHSNNFLFRKEVYFDSILQDDLEHLSKNESFLKEALREKSFRSFYQKYQHHLINYEAFEALETLRKDLDEGKGGKASNKEKDALSLLSSFEGRHPSSPFADVLRIFYFSEGYSNFFVNPSREPGLSINALSQKCSLIQIEEWAKEELWPFFLPFLKYAKQVAKEMEQAGVFVTDSIFNDEKTMLASLEIENRERAKMRRNLTNHPNLKTKSLRKISAMDATSFCQEARALGQMVTFENYVFKVVERVNDKAILVCLKSPFSNICFDYKSYPAYLGHTPKTFLNELIRPDAPWKGHYYCRYMLDYQKSSARLFLNNGFLRFLPKGIQERIIPFSNGDKVTLLSKEEFLRYKDLLQKEKDGPFSSSSPYQDFFLRDVNEFKTLPLYVTNSLKIGGEGYDCDFNRVNEPDGLSLKWGNDVSSILALMQIRLD